jgi:hypothetical protein
MWKSKKKIGRIYELKLFLSINVYRGTEVWLHSVSTSIIDGSASDPCHALAALPPGKELWYPLTWMHGGAQGRSGEKKMSSDRDSNSDASNPY